MTDADDHRREEIDRYLADGYDGNPRYLDAHKLGVATAIIDQLLRGGDDERIRRKLFAEWRGKQS